MDLKQFVRNGENGDRAVSPVIGVVLMVAITVVLAATIGTFVLGLGPGSNSSPPQAQLGFEASEDSSGDINEFTLNHNGGDDVDLAEVRVEGAASGSFTDVFGTGSGEVLTPGESVTVQAYDTGSDGDPDKWINARGDVSDSSSNTDVSGWNNIPEGDEIRLIYGDQVIKTYTFSSSTVDTS